MDMEGTCSESGLKSSIISGIVVVLFLISMALVFAITTVVAEEGEVEVKVNAPEYVEEGKTFEVTIDVENVIDFNAGQFDLCFDRSVVKVDKVEEGSIDGTEIPIAMSRIMERDMVRVMPMLPEAKGVSGSGYLAKITFKVKGDEGDECALEIDETESFLGNITADEIPVKEWISAEIEVGAGGKDKDEEEPPDITWDPMEEVISSVEGESMTFEIAVEDQEVDISWRINGTEVQVDEGETEAVFTKSADAGTWNVSAIATSTKTGLSSMHTWIWSVTATSTEAPEETPTPTPTLAPGEMAKPKATPTLAPGETAKPAVTPSSAEGKPKPTAPPGAEGKATPGFEAVFAIVALTGIAYILLQTRRRGKEG